jgi:hypothetical protein
VFSLYVFVYCSVWHGSCWLHTKWFAKQRVYETGTWICSSAELSLGGKNSLCFESPATLYARYNIYFNSIPRLWTSLKTAFGPSYFGQVFSEFEHFIPVAKLTEHGTSWTMDSLYAFKCKRFRITRHCKANFEALSLSLCNKADIIWPRIA